MHAWGVVRLGPLSFALCGTATQSRRAQFDPWVAALLPATMSTHLAV